jgi:hypothetical protein
MDTLDAQGQYFSHAEYRPNVEKWIRLGTSVDAIIRDDWMSKSLWLQFLALAVTGLSTGWLAGLSVSPVASPLIAGLLGLIGSLGAGAMLLGSSGWLNPSNPDEKKTLLQFDVRPVAVLALSVAIAVPAGIMARTYEIFGPEEARGRESTSTPPVLFSDYLGDCDELIALSRDPDTEYFRQRVREKSKMGRHLAEDLTDESLRLMVRALCTESPS